MARGNGAGPDNLTHIARLGRSPEKYHIFQALRIIEAAYKDSPALGEARRPREDKVRFGQEAELQFPPSSIRSFTEPAGSKPGRLINRFFGLFGPNGPLPLHLTEFARDRQRNHRDATLVEFANMLTHRMTTLFYRAWASGQPAVSYRDGNDHIAQKVASVAGFNGAELKKRDHFSDLGRLHFAGLLAQGPKNPDGLKSILSAFFEAPVQIIEFVGSWLELEPGDRWAIGAPAGLGQSTSIGTRVWSRSSKFCIRVGPLSLEDYNRLLPGGASLLRMKSIVRSYVGDALDWDVNLVLKADAVPSARLGGDTALGHTSWIGARKSASDADDLFLNVTAIPTQPTAEEPSKEESHD